MAMLNRASATGHRRLVLLCVSCLIPVVFILITTALLRSRPQKDDAFASLTPQHESNPALEPIRPIGKPAPNAAKTGPSLGHGIGDWVFDATRDGRNYGLAEEQCDAAFPDLYHEIDRAVAWRREQNLPNIQESQMDVSWREGGEIIRLMIYERQLYIVDYKWANHGYDVPRALALLHSIHRSIIAYGGQLPNVEFSMSLGDWPGDADGKWPIWVLTRAREEQDKWVMPDFGYWSWPLDVVGEYSQVRRDIRENEPKWEEKIKKAVWRGATSTNRLRDDLVRASAGRHWSDIREVIWSNITSVTEESKQLLLSMADHCNYQFVVHTEGHTYSGRGKYLLNCESVSIVHKPDWIEPHTHLMVDSGPSQNIIQVERDFSDLNRKMSHYLKKPEEAQRVAQNSAAVFRDRYLTPAAQACYWRKLFRAWSSVSFEPELYRTTMDSLGKVRRRSRGTPFETFVAAMVMPAD